MRIEPRPSRYQVDISSSWPMGRKVVDCLQVLTSEPDFTQEEVEVRWDLEEKKVGLFIREVLWAVFNVHHGTKCGGRYASKLAPTIPREQQIGFTRIS